MTGIFNEDRIGHRVWCTIEKDGVSKRYLVNWTHARVGESTSVKVTNADMSVSTDDGWAVVEVDV